MYNLWSMIHNMTYIIYDIYINISYIEYVVYTVLSKVCHTVLLILVWTTRRSSMHFKFFSTNSFGCANLICTLACVKYFQFQELWSFNLFQKFQTSSSMRHKLCGIVYALQDGRDTMGSWRIWLWPWRRKLFPV